MVRRSLRPHLNQIRGWVRQGRTDAWIAHQLEVTVQQIETFKRENELTPEDEGGEAGAATGGDFGDEIDLRAEDDAQIAVELEAAEARRLAEEAEREAEAEREKETRAAERAARSAARAAGDADKAEGDEDETPAMPRRRPRRSRARRAAAPSFEATFEHGEEGYGLWLDPAVADSPIYAEHWAGHRPVEVTVEEDQIVIRRAGPESDDD